MECLLKFGKKEHVEQLKNGIIHFSPIELFASVYKGILHKTTKYGLPTY